MAGLDPAFLPPGCWAEASSPASDAAVGGRPPGMSPSCRAAGTPEASLPSAAGASGSVPFSSTPVCAPPAAASAPTAAAALPPSWSAPACSTPTAASARPLLDMLPASSAAALLRAPPEPTSSSWLPLGILWTAPEGADMGRRLPESSGASRCAARSLMRSRLSLGTTAGGLSPARAKATETLRVGMPRLPLSTPGSAHWKGCVGARTKLLPCQNLPALPGRSARQSRLAWNSITTLCCTTLLYMKLQSASHRHGVVTGDGLVLSGRAHTMGQVCSGHACWAAEQEPSDPAADHLTRREPPTASARRHDPKHWTCGQPGRGCPAVGLPDSLAAIQCPSPAPPLCPQLHSVGLAGLVEGGGASSCTTAGRCLWGAGYSSCPCGRQSATVYWSPCGRAQCDHLGTHEQRASSSLTDWQLPKTVQYVAWLPAPASAPQDNSSLWIS